MRSLPLAERGLDRLRKQCRHHNVFPIYLPRYYYHPFWRNHPVSKQLRLLVAECVGYLEAMTWEEVASLIDNMSSGSSVMVGFDPGQRIDTYVRERVALGYLMDMVQEGYISFQDALFPNPETSEVLRCYPELADALDDEGLLVLDSAFEPLDMGIIYKEHLLHYHQCLRRGFRANPNFDFLNRFLRYRQEKLNCTFRIAVDHNRIMPREFIERICEFDIWFGPGFDREQLDDPAAVGRTVVGRRRPSPFEIGEEELDRTEFLWSHKDGIKTFVAEEVSAAAHRYGPFNINRFVHAERDIGAGVFRHFDGAVKVYRTMEYGSRLNSHIPDEPRALVKRKLFRIDGDIDANPWIDLTAHFFKGNEMVIEYFDPEGFEREFGHTIRTYTAAELARRSKEQ